MKDPLRTDSIGIFLRRGFWRLRQNTCRLTALLIMASGVVCGVLQGRKADALLLQRLDLLLCTNYELRHSQWWPDAFTASFASSALLLLIVLLLGLSVWGGLLAVAAAFFKAYGYGLAAGYLYAAYGMSGIGYNLLVLLPGALASMAALAQAALCAFRCSLGLLRSLGKAPLRDDPRAAVHSFLLQMLWQMLICALAAAADLLTALCFSGLFQF